LHTIPVSRGSVGINRYSKRTGFIVFLMIAASLTPAMVDIAVNKALARVQPEDFLNYAYATWIGTGFYRVEERKLWVLRAPQYHTWSWNLEKNANGG
jgi:hypothetical protein